jgi:ribonuclease J
MTITIHRGIDQIGGCITEIASASGSKILIDLGHNLPDGDNKDNDPLEKAENIDPILEGVDAVFYTHSHGDHIGFETHVAEKGIKQYIGKLSKKLMLLQRGHILYYHPSPELRASKKAIESFITYTTANTVEVGDIKVTPYYVSHSSPDAYMFVVECDGHAVLHTGDFRDHGYRGKGLERTIKKYIVSRHIDVLITEGTMLRRDDGRMISEEQLCEQATELVWKYKYVFFMCSTQDADRISSINHATNIVRGRRMLVDGYQYKVLEAFEEELGQGKYFLYQYNRKCYYRKRWDYVLDKDCKRGFTMLVRDNRNMRKSLDEMMPLLDKKQCCLVYSQFKGYIKPQHTAFIQSTYDFVHSYDWHFEYLHTSGHASRETLEMVCKKVNPKLAIIPIHREAQSDFQDLNLSERLKSKVVTKSASIEDVKIVIK